MEELIVRYLQQDISEEEARTLEAWLHEVSDNREMFFQLKGIFDSVKRRKRLSEEEVERSWQLMQSKLKLQPPVSRSQPAKRHSLRRTMKYAGLILAFALIGIAVGEYIGRRAGSSTAYTEISVPKGGKPNIVTLSDGSRIQLNAATTLRYPTRFSSSAREVFVDGEAWFEVADDSRIPFVVKLKQQTVIVHGTRFNIEAYHEEDNNIVTLISGSITLESFTSNGEKINSVRLKPGQKVHFDRQAGTVMMEEADISLAGTWTKGEYRFKDETLAQIFKRLENYYDIRIYLEDEELKDIKYTGTFSLNQSIREVLRIINHDDHFSFLQTETEIRIKKK
ncbi:MAG: DUF4974 domain-containing protein [Tannerellaceae bacterium]|jgi:ferric-dicitrate binding protein FerR (iron transport regulator)|nr:DUF4974 domain-containing protein [Tannerellaceae bacterium]